MRFYLIPVYVNFIEYSVSVHIHGFRTQLPTAFFPSNSGSFCIVYVVKDPQIVGQSREKMRAVYKLAEREMRWQCLWPLTLWFHRRE